MIRRAVIEYHGSTKTSENSLPWLREVLARRGFATAVRQGGRLTAEADLSRTGAWTALVHADRSRARLWWGFRREIAGRAAQKARRVAGLNPVGLEFAVRQQLGAARGHGSERPTAHD